MKTADTTIAIAQHAPARRRRTKIVATLGPATDNADPLIVKPIVRVQIPDDVRDIPLGIPDHGIRTALTGHEAPQVDAVAVTGKVEAQ